MGRGFGDEERGGNAVLVTYITTRKEALALFIAEDESVTAIDGVFFYLFADILESGKDTNRLNSVVAAYCIEKRRGNDRTYGTGIFG